MVCKLELAWYNFPELLQSVEAELRVFVKSGSLTALEIKDAGVAALRF